MKVTFFPRNDYPNNIEVCTHRLGKKITYCECTTDIPTYVQTTVLPYVMDLYNEYNLKTSCCFMDVYKNSAWNTTYGKQCIASGAIWPDLYFYPDPIKDYSETAIMKAWNRLLPWFVEQFGHIPNAVAFTSSVMSYKQYLGDKFLGAIYDPAYSARTTNTDYGIGVGNPDNVPYSQNKYYPRHFNMRIMDWGVWDNENYEFYRSFASDLIDATLALPKGGLITNFSHWHDLVKLDYNTDGTPIAGRNDYAINNGFKPYFNMLVQKNLNNNNEIYFSGFGEAIAYLVYRESIVKSTMYSPIGSENDKLIIRLEATNIPTISKYNDIEGEVQQLVDTNLLLTPISVKFSTAGTPLQGYTIRSNNNLINLGNNNYIVEIPYSDYPNAVIEKVN